MPVVHGVGGLNDTVFDPGEVNPEKANGFVFREDSADALLSTINRALKARNSRKTWRKLQENGMKGDYSWTKRAGEYTALYQALINGSGSMHNN